MVTTMITKIEESEGIVSMKMTMKKVVHLIIGLIEDLLLTLVGVATTIARVRLGVTEDL